MVGCSAPNCVNKTEKGFRLFRFPTDEKRKAIWLKNCRRDKWKTTSNSRLCEDHFEENQWELHRADEWRKLKPNAIPTLFNVPNPPKKLISTRRSTYKAHSALRQFRVLHLPYDGSAPVGSCSLNTKSMASVLSYHNLILSCGAEKPSSCVSVRKLRWDFSR
ncbi:peroxynitrite isomerase THAP4-like [Nilaparvata lugens]|uniref:peroxynitrite isomerase THAP4-like n=1 Tax=Nilaparvata lugens TaxID=108931 RepID=UPI00193E3CC5|nr:peroxynitrite isomerase THAP4-like [Nilaparvata lugens]